MSKRSLEPEIKKRKYKFLKLNKNVSLNKDYHDRNVFEYKFKPIKCICSCENEKDPKYKEFKNDLSKRTLDTIVSMLDSADCEFCMVFKRYKDLFHFKTPEKNSFVNDYQYVVNIELIDNSKAPVFRFPILFRSRLDMYCRENPNSLVEIEKFVNTETSVFCPVCNYFNFVEGPAANTFKLSGRILFVPTAINLKEKRKPFLDKKNNLTWFTAKEKVSEESLKNLNNQQIETFNILKKIKNFFGETNIGKHSFSPVGVIFAKSLENGLCFVFSKDVTESRCLLNFKKYDMSISTGNIYGILGNVVFENAHDGFQTDNATDYANRIANHTKSKGLGFHKPSTSYQQVQSDYMSGIFSCLKMVPQRSKNFSVRAVQPDEIGIFAFDTKDGKSCGLSLSLIPGIKITNRQNCKMNILQIFKQNFIPDLNGVDVILCGSNLESLILKSATPKSILYTILKISQQDIYFDLYIDFECKVGIIFSFHGMIIYPNTNVTMETKKWIETFFPDFFKNLKTHVLSFHGNMIPFFNKDNQSKMIGYLKSKPQEIEQFTNNYIQKMYSHSLSICLLYPQRNLVNKLDVGGQSVLLSIGCFKGDNVEESIICNKMSIERDQFLTKEDKRIPFIFKKSPILNVEILNISKENFKHNEIIFEIIGVVDYSQYFNYFNVLKRDNGFIFVYVDLFKGKKWKISNYELNVDGSNVHLILSITSINTCNEGVKLSTMHGQKGIVNKFLPTQDMPYFGNGMVPDIFINIAYINRMTLGQTSESIVGTHVCKTGKCTDLYHGESILNSTKKIPNVEYMDLYNGSTGEYIDDCPIYFIQYRRLRQEGDQVIQCTSIGQDEKRDVTTSQFQKGKTNGGRISMGIMETTNAMMSKSKQLMEDLNIKSSGFYENELNPNIGVISRTAATSVDILAQLGLELSIF